MHQYGSKRGTNLRDGDRRFSQSVHLAWDFSEHSVQNTGIFGLELGS